MTTEKPGLDHEVCHDSQTWSNSSMEYRMKIIDELQKFAV
jgi:hypothetical protein